MKFWTNLKWRKVVRDLHRDLGYLFIGLTVIYAFTGILLASKPDEKDASFREHRVAKTLQTNLSVDQLKGVWKNTFHNEPKLTRIIPYKEVYRLYVKGGLGEYDRSTGDLEVITYEEITTLKFMNDIHYNAGKRYTWLAHLYGMVLIFFAISGAVMIKGKKGFKRRGVWLMLVGVIIPVLLYFIM
ncbi:hypothetical protein EYV94_05415 [Puteibacter caeruleilacunae]|nr:hypothetical protein EYV94_05415 [Puteibacter caeruleilacunae]